MTNGEFQQAMIPGVLQTLRRGLLDLNEGLRSLLGGEASSPLLVQELLADRPAAEPPGASGRRSGAGREPGQARAHLALVVSRPAGPATGVASRASHAKARSARRRRGSPQFGQ